MMNTLQNYKVTNSVVFVLLSLFLIKSVSAQCPVSATASSINITCGDQVTLNAIPAGCKPLNNDFNAGIGTWASTAGGVITNGSTTPNASYSCMGVSPDPPQYFFMGSTSNTPRALQSNALDLVNSCPNTGGSACWYMKYSYQGQSGTCEGPDAPGEGVYLEYSTNCATWTQIGYWDPNGGNDAGLTNWNQYCVALPAAALTPATCFRWIQKASSGAGYDTWAIDNVRIILNTIGYTFDWGHDALAPATTPATPNVSPSVTTTYTVTYTNSGSGGTDNCSGSVVVNVTRPQVTTTPVSAICPGASTGLTAISPYQSVPPTSCGLATPAQYCDPISEQSNDFQVGSGATVHSYNSATNNIFGDFGPTNSNSRMQVLYLASELTTAGVKAGRIRSLSFDIAAVEDPGPYLDFSIYIGCTSKTVFASSTDFVPLASMSLVYGGTGKVQSLAGGWYTFNFDNDFNWQGTSNIVIQICYTVSGSSISCAAKTRDHSTAASIRSIQAVNNTFSYSATVCQSAVTFARTSTDRPNIKFGNCYPKTVTMSYNWSPATGLSSTTSRTPTATPPSSTTYTVSAYASPYTQCATTATVAVDVISTSASITPTSATVCPGPTPSVTLTASGVTSGTYSGPVTLSVTPSPAATFLNNAAAGVSSVMSVNGIAADATAQLTSVCVTIEEQRNQDLIIRLTAPNASTILLYNKTGTGVNMNNTCFVRTGGAANTGSVAGPGNFVPSAAFTGLTGVANGNWTLHVQDNNTTAGGAPPYELNNWNMTFNTTANNVVSYQWINTTTGLSSTSTPTPVASPTVATTYTVRVTDAMGCTATQTVVVDYCSSLPVNILNINAVREGKATKVTWSTAQEENNANFQVERSIDGLSFSDIGLVQGSGTSNTRHDYIYYDKSPSLGFNYYRIRQTDFDGKSSFTRVVSVFYSETTQGLLLESLSPIPAKDILNFIVQIASDDDIDVQILDMSGKIFYTEKRQFNAGRNMSDIDVSQLSSGVYMLRVIKSDGANAVKRFVK